MSWMFGGGPWWPLFASAKENREQISSAGIRANMEYHRTRHAELILQATQEMIAWEDLASQLENTHARK